MLRFQQHGRFPQQGGDTRGVWHPARPTVSGIWHRKLPSGASSYTTCLDCTVSDSGVVTAGSAARRWTSCNDTVNKDFDGDVLIQYDRLLPAMLADGIRMLIYVGMEVSPDPAAWQRPPISLCSAP